LNPTSAVSEPELRQNVAEETPVLIEEKKTELPQKRPVESNMMSRPYKSDQVH
jgi:hypothetical protein